MAKRIILYNLADNVTDEEFKEYVTTDKGPLINGLPGVKKYELVKITSSTTGNIPYRYAGILHLSNIDEYDQKATQMPEYQQFLQKFGPMAKEQLLKQFVVFPHDDIPEVFSFQALSYERKMDFNIASDDFQNFLNDAVNWIDNQSKLITKFLKEGIA